MLLTSLHEHCCLGMYLSLLLWQYQHTDKEIMTLQYTNTVGCHSLGSTTLHYKGNMIHFKTNYQECQKCGGHLDVFSYHRYRNKTVIRNLWLNPTLSKSTVFTLPCVKIWRKRHDRSRNFDGVVLHCLFLTVRWFCRGEHDTT